MFEDSFRSLCEAAANNEVFRSEYTAKNKTAVFTMLRRIIKLEIVFRRASLGGINNILYCRVYPNKTEDVFYFLPEVFVELGIDEYRSTFFSMIENEQRLKVCFDALWSIVSEHISRIEEAAANGLLPTRRDVAEDDYAERKLMFSEYPQKAREQFVLLTYTKGNAYSALLKGDTRKAIKLLEKSRLKGRSLEYQNRLCEYLKSHGDYKPMPDACNALRDDAFAERKALPVSIGIYTSITAILSIVFFAAKLIFDYFFSKGTIAVYGAPWYFCIILAALPAMFGAIFFRKGLMKLLYPKRAKSMIERDEMKNSKSVNTLAGCAFIAASAFAVFAFTMICLPAVRVYDDRFDTADEENIYEREEFLFSDIDVIYRISARYNDYGDRIERGSYVITTRDGRRFDLDSGLSEKQTREELLPMLEGYSIPIIELDSDRELPWKKES